MNNMFKYVVTGFDCDGAGYEETWIQYKGFDRNKAVEAKKICEEKGMGGWIRPLTPGPEGWRSAIMKQREEREKEIVFF